VKLKRHCHDAPWDISFNTFGSGQNKQVVSYIIAYSLVGTADYQCTIDGISKYDYSLNILDAEPWTQLVYDTNETGEPVTIKCGKPDGQGGTAGVSALVHVPTPGAANGPGR
jgi:hypothetical protein